MNRKQSSVDEDQLCRFGEDDLVRRLPEASLIAIGSCLNCDLPNNWIVLATKLGLNNEEIDRIRIWPNFGYEVLKVWQTRDRTTVRVLRDALTVMRRHDVVDQLDRAKKDPVDLTVVFRFQSGLKSEALNDAPYKTILLNCLRPRILSNFWAVLLTGRYKARLCLPSGSHLSWTSFVGQFRGQQIEVELIRMTENTGRALTLYSNRAQHVSSSRSCISYLEDEVLFFERFLESSENDISSIVFENAEQQQQQPAASEKLTSIPGFHPEIPVDSSRRAKTAEVLRNHLNVNGSYVLRTALIANSVVTLSAVFRKEIYHFSVMSKAGSGSKRVCFIYDDDGGCVAESIEELIAYYKNHVLSLPLPSVGEFYLTTPVP